MWSYARGGINCTRLFFTLSWLWKMLGAVPVSTLCVLCVARIGRAVNAIISKKLLLFAGIPGFVAVIAALILFVRTLMPSGSSALLPSAMGRRFLLRSVHLPGPHLVQGSVPRFL